MGLEEPQSVPSARGAVVTASEPADRLERTAGERARSVSAGSVERRYRRMALPGRIWRRAGWWLGRQSGAMILLYHRVARLTPDPFTLCVSPEHFAEQLGVLRRHTTVLSLPDLVKALDERRLPRRTVAITFDDGYADNLLNAKPLLARHDLPATVFVITGGLGARIEFWWDRLEQLVWNWPVLPTTVRLAAGGRELEVATNGGRRVLCREIWSHLKPLADDQRTAILDELSRQSGVVPAARPCRRPMTSEEVVALADGGLIEVGAHTVTHPSLSALPLAEQEREIVESRRACEVILGRPPASFAYPYGNDVRTATVEIVRRAGFRHAGVVLCDVIRERQDPLSLARMPIMDWDGDQFARRLLSGFFRRY